MTQLFVRGDKVKWDWGDGEKKGVIAEIHTHPISKIIDGESVRREGDAGSPAYIIEKPDGGYALCCGYELSPA